VIVLAFKIGHIQIENKIVLAPMAGVSNSPFRLLARQQGAGLVYAEMVSDKGLIYKNEKTINLLFMTDEEKPMAQQIFGSDLDTMVDAALYIDEHSNCDIIDINMGCPVPKVALRAQAGASLMKDPDKIYDIVSNIVKKVSKPVTVKIRSGWDEQSINAVEVAKKIESAGASAIIVHARSRAQGYEGKANLDVIKSVKQAVKIPVIGNGDVVDGPSAKHMLDYTGCDAVMVGRGALGNPWIFNEIHHYLIDGTIIKRPSDEQIRDMMLSHLESLIRLKGEHVALLEMRSHGPWYLKGIPNAGTLRKQLSQTKTKDEFISYVNQFFNQR
jgi:tRNA-dihydrouridine synthase B